MLCSHCSETIKPVVALDIDGTMGEFHDHFLRFALGYLTGHIPHYSPVDEYDGSVGFRDWFCARMRIGTEDWYDIKLAYRQGGMKRTMPCRGWPAGLTYSLRDLGIEIWVTTTRPYLRLDNIDPDTRFWLDNNEIEFDHLIYDEDKYSQLIQTIMPERVIAILEDLPEQIERAAGLFGVDKCLLWRAPHNRIIWDKWPKDQIVHVGDSIASEIDKRLAIWENHVHRAA